MINLECKHCGKPFTAKTTRTKYCSSTEKMGYEVLIVWESDVKKDREGEILKCLDFLRK